MTPKSDAPVENGKEKNILIIDEAQNLVTPSTDFWSFKSLRLHAALLMGLSVMMAALMRSNISVAVVCMVNSTAISILRQNQQNQSIIDDQNSKCELSTEAIADYEGTLVWDSSDVAMLFWVTFVAGYFTGIPAGFLSDRYGPKSILLISGFLHILGTFLTPVTATEFSYFYVVVARFIVGLGQGLVFPCLASMVSRWFPPAERSTVIAIYTTGNQLASVVGNPISAFLCKQKHIIGGWPLIYYFSGIFGLIWSVLWYLIVTNSPEKNRHMSEEEKLFITRALLSQDLEKRKVATKSTPWKAILKSPPVWANMLANMAGAYLNMLVIFYVPTYLKDVLYYDLKSNGLLSAIPWLVVVGVKFIISPTADKLRKSKALSPNFITKVSNSIACFGGALCLILIGFVDCTHANVAIVLLCACCAFFAFFIPGFLTSLVSIAPSYSGTISSCCRVTAQTGAVVSLYIAGAITKTGSRHEWQLVFLINAGVLIISGVVFLLFGSAEIQDWARSRRVSRQILSTASLQLTSELTKEAVKSDSPNPNIERKSSKVTFNVG